MAIGKLYKIGDSEFVADVNYHVFQHRAATNWWGELTLAESVPLDEGDMFEIEFEDRRRSKCHLKKRVNRAAGGFPPRYTYHVTGVSSIE
ncbi:MAG TPA: hypothetical protein VFF92_04255 [Dehalococcoidales bacterium]|nr:hypothetical protein [Dehalococcoidales bacterium]